LQPDIPRVVKRTIAAARMLYVSINSGRDETVVDSES
jgi:hypothetical protein